MRKQSKERPPPSLADLYGAPPMGPFSGDYGTCTGKTFSYQKESGLNRCTHIHEITYRHSYMHTYMCINTYIPTYITKCTQNCMALIKVVSTEGFQSCMFDCLHVDLQMTYMQMTINITFLMNDEISGELLN